MAGSFSQSTLHPFASPCRAQLGDEIVAEVINEDEKGEGVPRVIRGLGVMPLSHPAAQMLTGAVLGEWDSLQ